MIIPALSFFDDTMPSQLFTPPSSTADVPTIRLPDPERIFLDRAERFDALAKDHSLGEWLAFMGRLSRAQHQALQEMTDAELPDAESLERARIHRMPPLSTASFPRPSTWRDALGRIIELVNDDAPEGLRETLSTLMVTSSEGLEKLADQLLSGEPDKNDLPRLPLIAAALQVLFTRLAVQLDATRLPPMEARSICPVCGNLPVASIIRADGPVENLRYAHCTLCNTEWNAPRATCLLCGDDEKLALHEIDGDDGIARAESCESCNSYLKIIYQGKNAHVDPVADDLASIALDMLVDEAGFERAGPNLLLIGAGGE